MVFGQIKDFITNQMKMTHIYQPVMLIELLKSNGTADREQIAKAILSHDRSQIEYYEHKWFRQLVANSVGT